MFIITLSDTPKEPGRVLGVLGQSGEGPVCECTLAVRTFAGKSRTLTLRDYARGVEPVCALVVRLLAQVPAEQRPVSVGGVNHASLSVYRGPSIHDSRLVEHLVAWCSSVLLDVDVADELDERSATHMAREYRSTFDLLEHAAATLWWPGEAPPALRPLTDVPVHEGEDTGWVLEQDIPAYARRRLLHHLGSFRGPNPYAYFADDWREFLASLGAARLVRP